MFLSPALAADVAWSPGSATARKQLEAAEGGGNAQVTLLYTAPTAIRALQSFGDKFVTQHSRKTLRILGTVGEPINPEAWKWYNEVRRSSPPQLPCLRGACAGLGVPKQSTGQCAQPCVPGSLQAAPLGVPLSSEGLPNICMEERATRAALPDCKCSR